MIVCPHKGELVVGCIDYEALEVDGRCAGELDPEIVKDIASPASNHLYASPRYGM